MQRLAPMAEKTFDASKNPFLAVAQMLGFGLGKSKMLYLSTGIDDSISAISY